MKVQHLARSSVPFTLATACLGIALTLSDAGYAQSPSVSGHALGQRLKELREARKAAAQQAAEAHKEGKAAREEAREARLKSLGAKSDAGQARKQAGEARGEARRAWREHMRDRLAKLDASRAERRKALRAKLEKRWGKALAADPVRAEMRRHAWRIARLTQARLLAEDLDKKDMLERIDRLMEKESERHDKRMQKLAAAAGAAPSAAAESAPAPSAGPAPSGDTP